MVILINTASELNCVEMSTSRVIVKNLPQKCSEEKLREVFSLCGEVTDVRLMRTRSGTFRKFGFIGFQSVQQAQSALSKLHNTYIGRDALVGLGCFRTLPLLPGHWSDCVTLVLRGRV